MARAEVYIELTHELFEGKISIDLFFKEVRRLHAGDLPLLKYCTSVPANGRLIRPDREKVKSAALPGRNPRDAREEMSHG